MIFSYNWLKEYIPNLPSPEKLAEILTLKAFEVGKIEKKGNDFLLETDILPNRAPDCWSYLGLSREIASLLGKKTKEPVTKTKESGEDAENFPGLEIQNKKNINAYYLKMIKGVKVKSSPSWLKNRLALHGINSINNIIDIANLTMLEIGQPVHIFDCDKISGKKIIVREAKESEKFVSLENKAYYLPKRTLVIADEKDILALAGIKGGKKAEVGNKTKNIVIESASFSSPLILKTSKELNLITDASQRFGAGLSPYFAKLGADLTASLIEKYANGKILKSDFKFENIRLKSRINLSFAAIKNIVGEEIDKNKAEKILKSVYCDVKIGKLNLTVLPPPWREDIRIKEDLIEEIIRIYGYGKITPKRLISEIKTSKLGKDFGFQEILRKAAARTGFSEIYLYSFIGENDLDFLSGNALADLIEIKNFFRPEFKFLRPNLSLSMLKALSETAKNSPSALFFELSPVFRENKKWKDTADLQDNRLALGIFSDKSKKGQIFFELKSRLNAIFETLGVSKIEYIDRLNIGHDLINDMNKIYHPFKTSLMRAGNQIIGVIGEPSQEVKKYCGLKGEAALSEIELNKLFAELGAERKYQPILKYPSLYRDIAFLVPKKTKVIDVQNLIEIAAGKLLVGADLFDVYEDERALGGRKNLAFHLIFQSGEKTLSDKEADEIMKKIVKQLEANPEFETRR